MDTHLIVECMHLGNKSTNKNILRIVNVPHTSEFIKESRVLYPHIDLPHIATYYNSGKWHDRIINDISYKIFKNAKLDQICAGVWSVTLDNDNDDIYKWFDNNVKPFVHLKINTYFEDSEPEMSFYDKIKNYMYENPNYTMETYEQWVTVSDKYLELVNPEVTKDGMYVLTIHEIVALFLQYMYNFNSFIDESEARSFLNIKDDTDKNENITSSLGLKVDVCDFTNNISINQKKIFYSNFLSNFKDIFNITFTALYEIKKTVAFDKFARSSDVQPYDNTNLFWKGTPMTPTFDSCIFTYFHSATDIDLVDTNNIINKQTRVFGATQLEDNLIAKNAFTNLTNLVAPITLKPTTVNTVKEVTDTLISIIPQTDEEKDTTNNVITPTLLYINNISKEVKRSFEKIKYHKEFRYINDINVKTDFGNYMIDMISRVPQNDMIDIVADIQKCLNIISSVQSSISSIKGDDYQNDPQKKYTKQFVDKFKDDTKETLASMVIDRLYMYVSRFMEPSSVNMNKLGQDLVDLGVKKQRKARGFVYGIQCPSEREITNLEYEHSVHSYPKKDLLDVAFDNFAPHNNKKEYSFQVI